MKKTITIILSDTGEVLVNGPIQEKGVCLMKLEPAKDAILEHHRKAAASPIMPATILPMSKNGK